MNLSGLLRTFQKERRQARPNAQRASRKFGVKSFSLVADKSA
jgi:hypothetical protein